MAWDLTSVDGVRGYLAHTPFAADNVVILSGGNANFAYRVYLSSPYTTTGGGVSSVVLKHAEPIATKSFLYSTERQDFESAALRHVPKLTGPTSKASVPEIFYEDKKNRVLIMTDCGEDSTTLKALYRGGAPPSLEACQSIGHALGTFLARLHVSTRDDGPGSEVKAFFERNEEGRRIIALVTYGALFRVLGSGDDTSPGLFDPPIILFSDQREALTELCKTMYERMTTNSEVLAMGDFWPGNMIISENLHCTVIDWETSRPGIPGLEIGQFLGEMLTLRSFHPSATPAVDMTVSAFLNAYRDVSVQSGLSKEHHLLDMSWDILTRCGTHMVVVTPEVGWGGKETTREVAVEGLEYLFHGIHKDVDWLRQSVLKDFIS